MRRLALVLALTAAMTAAALPAAAAPENGKSATELDLDCGVDGQLTILVQFDTESAAGFDLAAGNGRQYVLSFLNFRVYAGALGDEPAEGLLFEEEKTWGKRKGYSRSLDCDGSIVLVDPVEGTFTAFFDVVLSGK